MKSSTNNLNPSTGSLRPNSSPEQLAEADQRLRATAYHEAGHAVVAQLLGRPILKVTIAPGNMLSGVRLGACEIRRGRVKPSKDWLEDEVLILLAGMIAESRLTGSYCRSGASHDLAGVRRLLSQTRASSQRQLERLEQRMIDKAEHLLEDPATMAAITSIADELIAKTTISGRAVRHWVEMAQQQCR